MALFEDTFDYDVGSLTAASPAFGNAFTSTSALPSLPSLSSAVASPSTGSAASIQGATIGNSSTPGTTAQQAASSNSSSWWSLTPGRVIVGLLGLIFVAAGLFMLAGRSPLSFSLPADPHLRVGSNGIRGSR